MLNGPTSITQLQQRIQANDQSAYRTLFELYYTKLFRLAMLITKSKQLSEEIVSDVFIAIWRKRDRITEIENFRLYLYIAVKNTSLNYLSQLAKTRAVDLTELDVELQQPFSDPEQILVTKEMNNRIYSAIQALPPKCRLIFKLIKEDGLSYRETANLLNLSVATVDNQLVIAIRKLSKACFYSFSARKKTS